MKKPHFFKARSRIGLIKEPIHQNELNIGVEEGPDAILDPLFLEQFRYVALTDFDFPSPENIEKENYYREVAILLDNFADKINNYLGEGETQVVIGGDNCVSFSSVIAVLNRKKNPKGLGYIQFDSHGDINQRATSPTDNFHGMYARAFVDNFDISEIENLVPDKIPVKNLFYVGNLDLDDGEKLFFEQNNIKHINQEEISSNSRNAARNLAKFIKGFKHIHINVDIDAFDKSDAPSTGIPAEKGLFLKDTLPLFEILAKHPSISLDLSEVNPRKKGIEKTVQTAQKIISAVLGFNF